MPSASSQRVNAFTLADQYLRTLGWPSTPTTRRVLAAWFMRESARVGGSPTDIYVVGNNPLNISCRTCSNYRSVGTHKIMIYDSPTTGIQAFNQLINGTGPGYRSIVAAFKMQPNNPTALITSINKSGWVTGKTNSYMYHSKGQLINGLASTYNGIGKTGDVNIINVPITNPPVVTPPAAKPFIDIPEGKTLDQKDLDYIFAKLTSITPGNPVSDALIKGILSNFLGWKWNKATRDQMQASLFQGAGLTKDALSGPAIADAIGGVTVNLFGGLAGKAAAVGAILMGVALMAFGAAVIIKDVYSGNGGGMLDVTPIIVKD